MADDLLSSKQAAEFLNTSRPTVWRLVSSGRLRASRVGDQWRVRRSELERYLESTSNTNVRGIRAGRIGMIR